MFLPPKNGQRIHIKDQLKMFEMSSGWIIATAMSCVMQKIGLQLGKVLTTNNNLITFAGILLCSYLAGQTETKCMQQNTAVQ